MNNFFKTNYQEITWVVVIVMFLVFGGLFIWWFISRNKKKKVVKSNLSKERKNILFEMIKRGKELNEEEASNLLDINIKKAHQYLFELAKERKIIMHKDIGEDNIYKLNIKKR